MSLESRGFFDFHLESIRQADPSLACPVRIGSRVLESMGVSLAVTEFNEFIEDLKVNNIRSEEMKEEV